MTPTLTFTVYGVAVPKGSMKAFVPKGWTRPVITHDNVKTKPWGQDISRTALETRGDRPVITDDALVLELQFFLPRPTSLSKRITRHAKRPDLDKLTRTVKDALKGIVYRDDSQVDELRCVKRYAGGPFDLEGVLGAPRLEVTVHR